MSETKNHLMDVLTEGFSLRAAEYVQHLGTEISTACESPIEELFALAFCCAELPIFENIGFLNFRPLPVLVPGADAARVHSAIASSTECGVWIFPQLSVGKYRADFAIIARFASGEKRLHRILVECDGHAFHEKTKEQAQRDKARDRFFTSAGYRVFRFTGSEIHRDPIASAQEVMSYLEDLAFGEDV